MPSTRELRRRIKSVKNTSQITHAMEMVAATKMRRAQTQALNGRPYSSTLHHSLSQLVKRLGEIRHPLVEGAGLSEQGSGKIGVVLFTTDKSLCGALNTNLFRKLMVSDLKLSQITFYTIGKKGRDFVVRSGSNLEADFENHETIHFKSATALRRLVVSDFLSGKLEMVYLLYPDFVSTLKQEPVLKELLPINPVILSEAKDINPKLYPSESKTHQGDTIDIMFDVPATSLLDYLLTHHLDTQIFQAMLETKASEHSARMIAMKNATDNAKELVSDLTLTYNGVRQAAITSELAEITTAGMALE